MSNTLVCRFTGVVPDALRTDEGLSRHALALSGLLGFAAAEALEKYPSQVPPLQAKIWGVTWVAGALTEQRVAKRTTTVVLGCQLPGAIKQPIDVLLQSVIGGGVMDGIASPNLDTPLFSFHPEYSRAESQVVRYCAPGLLESSVKALAQNLGVDPSCLSLAVFKRYHACRHALRIA